jgi:hypothetical protein
MLFEECSNWHVHLLTPYAGGPNPVYYGSGYLPTKDFWLLGAIFGAIFFGLWLAIGTLLLAPYTAPHATVAHHSFFSFRRNPSKERP